MLLAQAGFALGATIGGIIIDVLGIATIPLIALAFVIVSVVLAVTLRRVVGEAEQQTALETSRSPAGERRARPCGSRLGISAR